MNTKIYNSFINILIMNEIIIILNNLLLNDYKFCFYNKINYYYNC